MQIISTSNDEPDCIFCDSIYGSDFISSIIECPIYMHCRQARRNSEPYEWIGKQFSRTDSGHSRDAYPLRWLEVIHIPITHRRPNPNSVSEGSGSGTLSPSVKKRSDLKVSGSGWTSGSWLYNLQCEIKSVRHSIQRIRWVSRKRTKQNYCTRYSRLLLTPSESRSRYRRHLCLRREVRLQRESGLSVSLCWCGNSESNPKDRLYAIWGLPWQLHSHMAKLHDP